MVSYDGIRCDDGVISQLDRDISCFDLFYTSFYEITEHNYRKLSKIMFEVSKVFVDLSPLVYDLSADIIRTVFEQIDILSGTEDEYAIIFKKLSISDYEELRLIYGIERLFVKRGSRGAELYDMEGLILQKPTMKKKGFNSTGCGDTFNAQIICGLINGLSREELLRDAVEISACVAYEGFENYIKRK